MRTRHTGAGWLLIVAVLLAACSPRKLAEAVIPDSHFVLTRDVAYGNAPRQRLDVYRPRSARSAAPTVVFLYGGRWQHGSRTEYRLLGNALTRRGFVVVVPDYRLYPEVRFPAFVEDGAQAVRWTRNNAARFGIDTTQIFVMGHSAGAHTAALLALDERWLRGVGSHPARCAGMCRLPVRWTRCGLILTCRR